MAKKLSNKKLTLKKETVAGLSLNDMTTLKGGIDVTGCIETACCDTNNLMQCGLKTQHYLICDAVTQYATACVCIQL